MGEAEKRNNAIHRTRNLGEGGILSLVRTMSFPAIGSMAAVALFQIVDAIFIGRLGTAALGAVSVSFPIFTVVGGLGQVFGTGAASWISRFLGSKREGDANGIASAAMVGVLGAGILLAVLLMFFAEPILVLLGATESILPYAVGYTRLLVIANVVTMVNITMVSVVRAEGNARYGMVSVFISAGFNIVFDPILIFGFGLGMPGAAFATIISQIFAGGFLVASFIRRKNTCSISIRRGIVELPRLAHIATAGAPVFFLQLLGALALGLINLGAARFGDAAVAAVGLVFRILSVGMFPIYGFSSGFQPVAGYNYGSGRYDRVLGTIRTAMLWTFVFALVFSVAVIFAARPIMKGFSADPHVVGIGVGMLRRVTPLFPLFGLQIVTAVLFQALGYTLFAAMIIVARQALFFIPGVLLLPHYFGLEGIIYSQPVADVLTSILTMILMAVVLKHLRLRARTQVFEPS